uniref:hypothetical protein n=1 Tax=uncultured Chloroflexus sp. TaxID=214040 RepID=UPI002625D2BD
MDHTAIGRPHTPINAEIRRYHPRQHQTTDTALPHQDTTKRRGAIALDKIGGIRYTTQRCEGNGLTETVDRTSEGRSVAARVT